MPFVPYPQNSSAPSPEAAANAAMDGLDELLRFKRLLSHPIVGFNSLTGNIAAGGIPGFSLADHYLSVFDQGAKDISAKISPASRAIFDLSAIDMRENLAQGLAKHEAEQKRQLRSRALNETLARAAGALIAGTEGNDAYYAGAARDVLKADGLANGLSGEALDAQTAQSFGQRVIAPVVTARLRNGQVSEARAFFESHRDGMAAEDVDAFDAKLNKAENPPMLDNDRFALVAGTVGLDPTPDALDVEARAKLGILRAQVNAAIAMAEDGGKKLSPEERFHVARDAAAKAVKKYPVFGLSDDVQAILDTNPGAMRTPEPKPQPVKTRAKVRSIFDAGAFEQYPKPKFWPASQAQKRTLNLSLAGYSKALEDELRRPVDTVPYKIVRIGGKPYYEISDSTGNHYQPASFFVAVDEDARTRARQADERLQKIIDSPMGAAAYGGAYLAGANEEDEDRALEMGTAVGDLFAPIAAAYSAARTRGAGSFNRLADTGTERRVSDYLARKNAEAIEQKANVLSPKSDRVELQLENTDQPETPDNLRNIASRSGSSTSKNYRTTFLIANPELQGQVVVHHAVEQQIMKLYPNLFSKTELHSLENLRGIPKELNSSLHLSAIRKELNTFYKNSPAATREDVLAEVTRIDEKYGHLFKPSVGKK